MIMNGLSQFAAEFAALPRRLKRALREVGAEPEARAEIDAAIQDAAFELESLVEPAAALTVAATFLPQLIAGAVVLKAQIREIESLRQIQLETLDTPLPEDAAVLARGVEVHHR